MIHTGAGKCKPGNKPDRFILYNFDIGGDRPKYEHIVFLRENVTQLLRVKREIVLLGTTDRAGTGGGNQELAKKRAANTLAFLRSEVANGFEARAGSENEFGFFLKTDWGQRFDGAFDENERAVLICTYAPGYFSKRKWSSH